jgi:plasmid replication initiation protein
MNIVKVKSNLVVSSNDLVHAKYDLTLWQKRVFVYAISQLQKETKEFEPIRMNIADIIKFYKGSDGKKTYSTIIEAPKSLDTTLEIPYISKEGNLRYGFIKLLKNYTIPGDDEEGNQYIELCFNNDLRPHLLELKEKFLKYDIKNIVDLQSTYSFRMFEILKSYEYRKEVEFDIEYLREILEVKNIYKSFKDFKKRIVDKAREDLLKYCDIGFTYKEKKASKGKKIESLVFTIFKNDPSVKQEGSDEPINEVVNATIINIVVNEEKNATIDTDKDKLFLKYTPSVISDFGVSPTVFLKLLETHTEQEVIQAIDLSKEERAKGKVKNIAGFFVEALKKGFQSQQSIHKIKETEKKAKIDSEKLKEQEAKDKVQDFKRREGERKQKIVENLIAEDAPIIKEAILEIQNSMFRSSYDSKKSVKENMLNPMFMGGIMNFLEKLNADVFNAKN